jgi:hypothetical protein
MDLTFARDLTYKLQMRIEMQCGGYWPWWIRTTINGSKVRCPAIGRRASAGESNNLLATAALPPATLAAQIHGPRHDPHLAHVTQSQ